ncbi:helix-turn-helix domain-containing protein [Nonomuraea typhae]|uniref:helix-turn-helix domain-containing protein n=1 Tax=Nonomuraea typhae TaxID=2603600 RepID=UPI0012FC0F27|nr:helix-turn-helix transcriptional regulator [Nonomuraea typhae]
MQPHAQLDEAMNQRRLELRLTWKQVAERARVSTESLSAIRRGRYRPAELTARGIEDALQWEWGKVYEILGESPQAAEDPPATEPDTEERSAATPALEAILAAIQQDLANLRGEVRQLREEVAADKDAEPDNGHNDLKTG